MKFHPTCAPGSDVSWHHLSPGSRTFLGEDFIPEGKPFGSSGNGAWAGDFMYMSLMPSGEPVSLRKQDLEQLKLVMAWVENCPKVFPAFLGVALVANKPWKEMWKKPAIDTVVWLSNKLISHNMQGREEKKAIASGRILILSMKVKAKKTEI